MDGILNPKLYAVVRDLYDEVVGEFAGQDLNSAEFLGSVPYALMFEHPGRTGRIVEAALSGEFREQAKTCIEACYSDHGGGDLEFYVCDAVEDFINYIIPRTVGLENGTEIFDRYFRELDCSLYGKSCLVTILALLRDIHDHSGRARVLPPGYRLIWVFSNPGPLNIPYTRERTVPFLEIKKSGHPIGHGRDLAGDHAFQIIQYSASLPKNRELLSEVYSLMHDVISKFVLAARLKTYSTAYSDYFGFRMVGHLSAFSMNLMNYPDNRIERGESREIDDSAGIGIDKLLTKLHPQPFSRFLVINQKIEDAMYRRRNVLLGSAKEQKLSDIDQLLDYFQVLEAIVPSEGSQNISLYAARLLRSPNHIPNQATDLFRFIKDMHTIRNSVLHGRVDDVLAGKVKNIKNDLDIPRLRHIVYSLVCLHIMNGPLRDAGTQLLLGENVELLREYPVNQAEWAEWTERQRRTLSQDSGVVFW